MNTSTLIKLATVSAAVAALAACAPKPKVEPAVPTTPTVPTGPQYPTAPTGPVTGGNVGAVMPGSEQDFVVHVGDRIYFDLDSYSVRPEAQPRLDAQAAWLSRYPQVTIRIEGNADERGTREYNLALGARRLRIFEAPRAPSSITGPEPASPQVRSGGDQPSSAATGRSRV